MLSTHICDSHAMKLSHGMWLTTSCLVLYEELYWRSGVSADAWAESWLAQLRRRNIVVGDVASSLKTYLFLSFVIYALGTYCWEPELAACVYRDDCRAAVAHIDMLQVPLSGGQTARRQQLQTSIAHCMPGLQRVFNRRWISSHSQWCSPACARVMIVDGNEKLCPQCCHVTWTSPSAELPAAMNVESCSNTCRKGCVTCHEQAHKAQEPAMRAILHAKAKRKRQKRQRLRPFADRLLQSCHTVKDNGIARAHRAGGVLAAAFTCGTIAIPSRFHIAECLPQVLRYLWRLQVNNPELELVGYDDWCHLAPHIQQYGTDTLRQLKGFINRWHMKGHRRFRCWSRYAADVYRDLWDWQSETLQAAEDVDRLVAEELSGRVHLHDIDHRGLSSLPLALVARALCDEMLPLNVTFRTHDGDAPSHHVVNMRSEGGSARVINALRPKEMRLEWALRGHGWQAPAGAWLSAVHSESTRRTVSGCPQPVLASLLRALRGVLPISVVLRRRRNTSMMERQWRALNAARGSLRYVAPVIFDFPLLHNAHCLNEKARPCAQIKKSARDSEEDKDSERGRARCKSKRGDTECPQERQRERGRSGQEAIGDRDRRDAPHEQDLHVQKRAMLKARNSQKPLPSGLRRSAEAHAEAQAV